jgi:ketosteroid isomerase-like protein
METTSTAHELAVRQVLARFVDALNRRDLAAYAGLWWPNAVWELTAPVNLVLEGAERIVAQATELLGGFDLLVAMAHEPVVAVHEDRATARWLLHELNRTLAGQGATTYALYADELTRRAGEWRFQHRTFATLYSQEIPLPGPAYPLPPALANLGTPA